MNIVFTKFVKPLCKKDDSTPYKAIFGGDGDLWILPVSNRLRKEQAVEIKR